MVLIGLFFTVILTAVAVTGCGGENQGDTAATGETTTTFSYELTRTRPGTVEIADPPGDATRDDGTPLMTRSIVDIEKVSIAAEGEDLVFTLTVGEAIPSVKPAELLGIEWGFLLDTDGDGKPDWGLYTAYPEGGLSYGLYDQQTKERFPDQQFPGSFSLDGATITWTLPVSAIRSPQEFQWLAYTDAGIIPESDQDPIRKINDTVPAEAWPKGSRWLEYP